ncbi:MAG: hypothetical protein KDK27_19970, partial [Leptospiraceae bacterium]|nr:hypothetical protein [Leptospiraceae bacterium]
DSRRVMGLIAYGDTGNLLESLHEQLQHHIESIGLPNTEINWLNLTFPANRGEKLERVLEDELALQLEKEPTETIPHLLRRHAPLVNAADHNRRTLWLNWGIFGANRDRQPPLTPSELESWLRLSSGYLSMHCPADLRIVSFLVIELAENRQQRLMKSLEKLRSQSWCRRSEFRLSILQPLGNILEGDLFDFLDERANSSCPPAIQDEMARLLFAKTGGEFEATVALIQQAEAGSWYDLQAQLKGTHGATQPEDDEPF